MRKTVVLLALLTSAAPALAQAPAAAVPPELTDPRTADRLADAMQTMSDAVLGLRVGELNAALEGRRASASEQRLTVRDLGRRDDPNFDRDFHQRIANARPMIHQSMKALSDALPAMMQGLEQAQQSIERAIANMPDPTYPRR
jgi:hypothetical protein